MLTRPALPLTRVCKKFCMRQDASGFELLADLLALPVVSAHGVGGVRGSYRGTGGGPSTTQIASIFYKVELQA